MYYVLIVIHVYGEHQCGANLLLNQL